MERYERRQIELMRVPCPLCGSDDCSTIHTERTQYFGAPVALSVVRCRKCGLDYTNPRIAEVNAVYEDGKPCRAEEIKAYNKRKRPVFENALRRIARFKPPPGVVLDVGCGTGLFLDMARKRGYTVCGIEPARASAECARSQLGLDVHSCRLEECRFAARSFDVVSLWDVLEHVADPVGAVRLAAQLLKPGGLLALRMPGALFHRIKARVLPLLGRGSARVYDPHYHLTFFSASTIRRLLLQEGFSGIKVRTTLPEIGGRGGISDFLRWSWAVFASGISRVSGVFLDNLEVYAFRDKRVEELAAAGAHEA